MKNYHICLTILAYSALMYSCQSSIVLAKYPLWNGKISKKQFSFQKESKLSLIIESKGSLIRLHKAGSVSHVIIDGRDSLCASIGILIDSTTFWYTEVNKFHVKKGEWVRIGDTLGVARYDSVKKRFELTLQVSKGDRFLDRLEVLDSLRLFQ